MTVIEAIASLERTVGIMFKKYGIVLLAALLVAPLSACLLDPKEPPEEKKVPPPIITFEDLSEREHVLTNLVGSYLARNATEYERLLDPDKYTFFFSTGDVGGQIPAQWGITEDLPATRNLLDPNYSGEKRALSIDLELIYNILQWVPIPGDAGETWWAVTVLYNFNIKTADDFTYLSTPSAQAQFVVRDVGTAEAPQWRLVQWHDIGA